MRLGKHTKRWQRREATRQRLYDAAMVAFRHDGFEHARVEDIAKAAGVSHGTFYVHFATKDDVLVEWLRRAEARVAAEVTTVGGAGLRAVLDCSAFVLAEEWERAPELLQSVAPVAVRLAFGATAGRAVEAHVLPAVLATHFRSAGERGEIDGSLSADVLAVLFLGSLFVAALSLRVDTPAEDRRTVLAAAVDVFFGGARAQAGGGRADEALRPPT